jgi:hypothetical protein
MNRSRGSAGKVTGKRASKEAGRRSSQPTGTRPTKARKPHNSRPAADYAGLGDILKKIGGERQTVSQAGEMVEMSRAERTLRLLVGRALEGKARDVAQLLRLMMKHPSISKSCREETVIFINGPMAEL